MPEKRREVRRKRLESDTLGSVEVPADALYGAQTARAVVNFAISGWRLPARLLTSLARIKAAYARAHGELGLLTEQIAAAIVGAANEVAARVHLEQFPVDVFQTGSGTSTNMNMNEVLGCLAQVRLAGEGGPCPAVHPNDHVNLGQSSNDVIPSAIHIASALAWRDEVRPAAAEVVGDLGRLAVRHESTVTLGRTHLMDAVPTTYGRIFDAWARRLQASLARTDLAAAELCSLPLGGTAVGTGIGARPAAVGRVLELLRQETDLPLTLDGNPAVGIAAQEALIAFSDGLAGIARVLYAIASDVRWRASGPFGGLGELRLPAVQPGSSIIPGKVNPVIPEAVVQVAIEVEGLASACRASAALHQLDLSHANPLLAWNLDAMALLVAGACAVFSSRCLGELEVDTARAERLAATSPALATALAGRVGYERAAAVARAAEAAGEPVLTTARRLAILPETELGELLDLPRLAGVRHS